MRERRKEEREALASLYDSRRSGARFTSGQELKLLYSTKAKRGYRNHKFSPRIWTKSWESRKLRVLEVYTGLPWVVFHATRGKELVLISIEFV